MSNVRLNPIAEYRKSVLSALTNRSIPAAITKRWNERVVGNNWFGASGAGAYLNRYGRGIMAPKLCGLARKAEHEGDVGFAVTCWAKAAELAGVAGIESQDAPALMRLLEGTGNIYQPLEESDEDEDSKRTARNVGKAAFDGVAPGTLVTMQPVDGMSQGHYVNNPAYWGQPKKYGHRMVVFATGHEVWWQSRSQMLKESPGAELDEALMAVAKLQGPFILDGERLYYDCTGAERMTAAQAQTVNDRNGGTTDIPSPVFAIFRCLYFAGEDLRRGNDVARLDAAKLIGYDLERLCPDGFEVLPTARTRQTKQLLCDMQEREGREGEVWTQWDAPYTPGKGGKWDDQLVTVRTKYKLTVDAFVIAVNPTSAEGRAFSSLTVAAYTPEGDQVTIGSVGTGFTMQETYDLEQRIANVTAEATVIEIECQGFTENGSMIHASYKGVREDKSPGDCVLPAWRSGPIVS